MPVFESITYVEDGPLARLTMNRPKQGNMFDRTMLLELKQALEENRRESRTRVVILTGAGDRFFCLGGEHEDDGEAEGILYPTVLPIIDVYEAIDRHPKPVIASVNGYAVGGGNVLQVVCDLTIAKRSAVFRQVGPLVGSYDAGYGTWYLEDLIGRKRAKELWFLNERLTAEQALEFGLVNFVVDDEQLSEATTALATKLASRGSHALAAVKASFTARTGGVGGMARIAHDLLMPFYYRTSESRELARAFDEKRPPDPTKFGR